jgi:isoleucyl-tRNA synthetase
MEVFDDAVRRFLLPLWNVYAFFVTYANAGGFDPADDDDVPVAERPILDRWVLSQLAHTAATARDRLNAYDATTAGRRIAAFVEDLSNWYVRRARRRFWDPGGGSSADTRAAYLTLHECLVTLAQLLAPFTPFVAETLWRNLMAGRDGAPDSVHLSDYPTADEVRIDPRLDEAMTAAREIVELGRRIRTETRIRVRQPLLEAAVHHPGDHDALEPLFDLIGEELNVKRVVFAESAEQLGRWRAKPNFKMLGPRLGSRVQAVAAALGADDGTIAGALARGETVPLELSDGTIELSPEDVDLVQETLEGWGVAGGGGLTVALELELTPELRLEGLARELVRVVQDARKAAGLEVSDRVVLGLEVDADVGAALAGYRAWIAAETLAVEVVEGAAPGASYDEPFAFDDARGRISLRRAEAGSA